MTVASLSPCLDLVTTQVKSACRYEYSILVAVLRLMTKIVQEISWQLSVDTVQHWMSFTQLLMHHDREDVVLLVAGLLGAMIKVKNVPLLIEVYRYCKLNGFLINIVYNKFAFVLQQAPGC